MGDAMTAITGASPIAFLDVAYASDAAGVGCVAADTWTAAAPVLEFGRRFAGIATDYVPGKFYKRELPLLLAVIDTLSFRPASLVVDGYVWLGAADAPGLGAHLFEALQSAIPVIGVAKSRYRNDTWSVHVCRGNSRRPLFVTSAGIEIATAAELVAKMHGKYRIPTLLQRVDRLARAALAEREGP